MTALSLSLFHLGLLSICLLGFLQLAFSTERYGEHLFGRAPPPWSQRFGRVAGWAFLAISLAWSVATLGEGVGVALCLGWFSLAALVWVFIFPKWPYQPLLKLKPQRTQQEMLDGPNDAAIRSRRGLAVGLLVLTVFVFISELCSVSESALKRPNAIHGVVGPWTFTLAETHQNAPEIVEMEIPMKEFRLSFCQACDHQIRQATLKVNRPRSERTTGMAFTGQRWERKVEISLPSTLTAESELWLTVVGKDGSVHQASWRMDRASAASVAWFERQRRATYAQH